MIGPYHAVQPPQDQLASLLAHLLPPGLLLLLTRLAASRPARTRDPLQLRWWCLVGAWVGAARRQVLLQDCCEPALLRPNERIARKAEAKSVAKASYDLGLVELAHADSVRWVLL
jgi:hypothetical protein